MTEKQEVKDNFKYIVRVVNTDLDGNKPTIAALRKIKGVGHSFASMLCNHTGIAKNQKIGTLSDSEIKSLNSSLETASDFAPVWMLNRRRDLESNEDKHLVTNDLVFARDSDIRLIRKIKSYKGMRHSSSLPVRGQRTRSNFRKNKGKVHLGVQRAKQKGGKK